MPPVLRIDKHHLIQNTIQQNKEGIVENTNDANAYLHNTTTQKYNLSQNVEDCLTQSSGPKTMELSKDYRITPKHSQDKTAIQIAELLKQYQVLFPINGIERKEMVEALERMKIPLQLQTKPTQLPTRHCQYIRVKPSPEGRLILHYDNKLAHPHKQKATWIRLDTIAPNKGRDTTPYQKSRWYSHRELGRRQLPETLLRHV